MNQEGQGDSTHKFQEKVQTSLNLSDDQQPKVTKAQDQITNQTQQKEVEINTSKLRQNIYQMKTDAGKINVEVISLPQYKWVIIVYAGTLQVDGSLQLGMKTPFSEKPTVLDLGADQHQAESQDFCSKLSKELGCSIVLSMNLQGGLSIKDQRSIIKFLADIFKPGETKQQEKLEQKSESGFLKKQPNKAQFDT